MGSGHNAVRRLLFSLLDDPSRLFSRHVPIPQSFLGSSDPGRGGPDKWAPGVSLGIWGFLCKSFCADLLLTDTHPDSKSSGTRE